MMIYLRTKTSTSMCILEQIEVGKSNLVRNEQLFRYKLNRIAAENSVVHVGFSVGMRYEDVDPSNTMIAELAKNTFEE